MAVWLDGLERAAATEAYYPMVRELKPLPRKMLSRRQRDSGAPILRYRDVPFLPHLVFARAAGVGRLAGYPGIIGFVANGGEPAQISDAGIEALRAREREGGGAIPGGTPVGRIFRAGDVVDVVGSPLAGHRARVEAASSVPIEEIDGDTLLDLVIEMFGRATRVKIAVADVQKANG